MISRRVWRTWFDEVDSQTRGRSAHTPTEAKWSERSVSIDKTIAKATIVLSPPDCQQAGRPERSYVNGAARCEMAWTSVDLNVARVVVEAERAEQRRASQIVLFFP